MFVVMATIFGTKLATTLPFGTLAYTVKTSVYPRAFCGSGLHYSVD